MSFWRRSGRKEIVLPPGAVAASAVRSMPPTPLAVAIGRAFRWQEMIECGAAGSNSDLARKLKLDQYYIARTIRLASLAPGIIEAILDGQEPDRLSLLGCGRTCRWSGRNNTNWLDWRRSGMRTTHKRQLFAELTVVDICVRCWKTCLHEAGHAVAGRRLLKRTVRAVVYEASAGAAYLDIEATMPRTFEEALAIAAGPAAEALAEEGCTLAGSSRSRIPLGNRPSAGRTGCGPQHQRKPCSAPRRDERGY